MSIPSEQNSPGNGPSRMMAHNAMALSSWPCSCYGVVVWSQREPAPMTPAEPAAQVCGMIAGLISARRISPTTDQQLPNNLKYKLDDLRTLAESA